MKVFITRKNCKEGIEELKKTFDVEVHDSWIPLPKEELKRRACGSDILITYYNDKIDEDFLSAVPGLKLIVSYGGIDGIDLEAAQKSAVTVISPESSYPWIVAGVAEITWGLMIAVGRRFQECSHFVRKGYFTHSEQGNHLLLGEGLAGRTVGILGAGTIGRAVALRGVGFGVNMIYHDVVPNAEIESLGAKWVDKDTLFREADYLTVHLSDIDENVHFIGREELALMKPSAILINTARGRMVDEDALTEALQNGRLAGAGFDVYEHEPQVPEIWNVMPNVVLLPHIGGSLKQERIEHFNKIVKICKDFQRKVNA